MRILHLAKYYWPRSGGMERVVQTLVEGAANLGHQVEVWLYGGIRLRGKLRLQEELLFVEEERARPGHRQRTEIARGPASPFRTLRRSGPAKRGNGAGHRMSAPGTD